MEASCASVRRTPTLASGQRRGTKNTPAPACNPFLFLLLLVVAVLSCCCCCVNAFVVIVHSPSKALVGPAERRASQSAKTVVWMGKDFRSADSGKRKMRNIRTGGSTKADFMRPLGKLIETGGGSTRNRQTLKPLNQTEELAMVRATKKLKQCVQAREDLTRDLGRPPTLEEWAGAFHMGPDDFGTGIKVLHRASQVLVNSNSAFIASIVQKYYSTGVDSADLFQEGVAGFLKAAHQFDESRDCRLRTFAYRTVNQNVFFAAAKASTFLSSPQDVLRNVFKVNRLKRQYEREGVEKEEEVLVLIAQELKCRVKKAALIERAARPLVYADSLGEYVDNHRCRLASEGEMVPTPLEYVSTMRLRGYIDDALHALDPVERDILRMLKGLDDGMRRTPAQVARLLEIKTKEVRQIEASALAKLQQALAPDMEDVLSCARAADDRDRQGLYTAPFQGRDPVRFSSY
ncbi:hypothetical protein VYU27_005814 [Nannochloropsis oceanica]